ncbi:MAG: hypothetical protein Q4G62_04030 [Pseudomonadota bacterium]|nr:hypothetical protein [Pseudomonadota bacterium]
MLDQELIGLHAVIAAHKIIESDTAVAAGIKKYGCHYLSRVSPVAQNRLREIATRQSLAIRRTPALSQINFCHTDLCGGFVWQGNESELQMRIRIITIYK